jgi:hypothetical protein
MCVRRRESPIERHRDLGSVRDAVGERGC